MRNQIALPLVVFACAVGATLAYERAQPSGPSDSAGRVQPAFTLASEDEVSRLANASAAVHRAQLERLLVRRGGRKAARAWVEAQLRNGAPARSVSAASTPSVTKAREWLDGIPRGIAAFEPEVVELEEASNSEVRVRGALVVQLRQAMDRTRSLRTPLTVAIQAIRPAGGQAAAQRFRVTAVSLGGSDGLRSYANPVIVHGRDVDVVAPASLERFARAASEEGSSALPQLRARYAQAAGPRGTTIYVVDEAAQVPRLFAAHSEEPADVPLHPTGWTYEDGDVVLNFSKLAAASDVQQIATVRHELVHVVTLPLVRKAPTMILEGLATWEETRRISATTSLTIDLRPLLAAFREERLGYDDLLESTEMDFGRTGEAEVQLGYLAGYATIGYILSEYGSVRLQRFLASLRDGVGMEVALERLGITPLALQRKVRVWAAEHVAGTGPSTGLSPGGER